MVNIKRCKICEKDKPFDEFYSYLKTSKTKGEYTYYQPNCKECSIQKNMKNYKEKYDTQYKYYKRNYEKTTKYKKRAKVRREQKKEYYQEYQKNNKDKLKKYRLNRIDKEKKHEITDHELNKLYNYTDYKCMYCGMTERKHQEIQGQKLHRDHAINKGSNGIDNCVLACRNCNSAKRDWDWNKWFVPTNERYSEERYIAIETWLNSFKN